MIREAIEPAIVAIETEFKTRTEALDLREHTLELKENRFNEIMKGLTAKEASLTEWEKVLTDRADTVESKEQDMTALAATVTRQQQDFTNYRSMELSKLETRQRTLTADEKTVALQKELNGTEKKQTEIIKAKLVSERASLDSAWNQLKYDKLK